MVSRTMVMPLIVPADRTDVDRANGRGNDGHSGATLGATFITVTARPPIHAGLSALFGRRRPTNLKGSD